MYITIIVFCGINYILKLQDSNNLILFLFFKNENVYSLSFTKIKKKFLSRMRLELKKFPEFR